MRWPSQRKGLRSFCGSVGTGTLLSNSQAVKSRKNLSYLAVIWTVGTLPMAQWMMGVELLYHGRSLPAPTHMGTHMLCVDSLRRFLRNCCFCVQFYCSLLIVSSVQRADLVPSGCDCWVSCHFGAGDSPHHKAGVETKAHATSYIVCKWRKWI